MKINRKYAKKKLRRYIFKMVLKYLGERGKVSELQYEMLNKTELRKMRELMREAGAIKKPAAH